MSDAADTDRAPTKRGKKRGRGPAGPPGWPSPDRLKGAPPATWSGKTLHHPAFRVGEVKRGKS